MKRLVALMMCAVSLGAAAQIDWDFPYNPDGNNDGYIFSEDLLDLLAVYGQEFNSEELYLSQDSSSLIVFVGAKTTVDCLEACESLGLQLMNSKDLLRFRTFLTLPEVSLPSGNVQPLDYSVNMWYLKDDQQYPDPPDWNMTFINRSPIPNGWNGSGWNEIKPSFTVGNSSGYYEGTQHDCWCIAKQRPRVEWHRITESEWDENKDQLSEDGWRLHSVEGNNVFFWRWAE